MADLLILYSVTTFLTILVLLILSQIGHGMNSRPGEIQTQMDKLWFRQLRSDIKMLTFWETALYANKHISEIQKFWYNACQIYKKVQIIQNLR